MLYHPYEYISCIAKHRSISKAAAELFISQPYLSKILSSLESQYHTAFFDRSSFPITITDAGKCYLEYAARAQALEREFHGKIDEISTEHAGTLTIGTPTSTGSYFLPLLLPAYKKDFSQVTIHLEEKNSDDLIRLLQDHKIDLCIFSRPIYPSDICYEYIMDETLYLAVPPAHPFMQYCNPPSQPIATLDDEYIPLLDKQPFILLPTNLGTGQLTREFLQTYHIEPDIVLTTKSVSTAFRLTAQNMGFSFVTNQSLNSSKFQNSPGLLKLGKFGLNRAVVAAYPKATYLPYYVRAFILYMKYLGTLQSKQLIDGTYGITLPSFRHQKH